MIAIAAANATSLSAEQGRGGLRALGPVEIRMGTVGNQQDLETSRAERSGVFWMSRKLPESPVVSSSPSDCLSQRLPSAR